MKTVFKPRKTIRLRERDYSRQGYYHVTICTYNRLEIFGKIENHEMRLNQYGNIARDSWNDLPNHHKNIKLDEFVVMPNHIHGIINVNVGAGSKPALKTKSSINKNNDDKYNGKIFDKSKRVGL